MSAHPFVPRPVAKNVPFRARAAEGPERLRAASTRDALLRAHAFEQGVLHGYFAAGAATATEFAEALSYLNEVARFCDAEFARDEEIAMGTELPA
jgi:hypothetical protein